MNELRIHILLVAGTVAGLALAHRTAVSMRLERETALVRRDLEGILAARAEELRRLAGSWRGEWRRLARDIRREALEVRVFLRREFAGVPAAVRQLVSPRA
jgi:hypothetical protein